MTGSKPGNKESQSNRSKEEDGVTRNAHPPECLHGRRLHEFRSRGLDTAHVEFDVTRWSVYSEASGLKKGARGLRWIVSDLSQQRYSEELQRSQQANRTTITSLAVIENAILLSTDGDWLQSVLQPTRRAKPLTSSEAFLAASKFLRLHESKTDSLRSFTRLDDNWRLPYLQLIKGKVGSEQDHKTRLLELLLCPTSSKSRNGVIAALPAWTSVAPSLGGSAISLGATEDGFAGYLGILPIAVP